MGGEPSHSECTESSLGLPQASCDRQDLIFCLMSSTPRRTAIVAGERRFIPQRTWRLLRWRQAPDQEGCGGRSSATRFSGMNGAIPASSHYSGNVSGVLQRNGA